MTPTNSDLGFGADLGFAVDLSFALDSLERPGCVSPNYIPANKDFLSIENLKNIVIQIEKWKAIAFEQNINISQEVDNLKQITDDTVFTLYREEKVNSEMNMDKFNSSLVLLVHQITVRSMYCNQIITKIMTMKGLEAIKLVYQKFKNEDVIQFYNKKLLTDLPHVISLRPISDLEEIYNLYDKMIFSIHMNPEDVTMKELTLGSDCASESKII